MDFTILVQGRLWQYSFDFYAQNYLNNNLFFSTWDYNHIDNTDILNNKSRILYNKPPENCGHQNLLCQIVSTLEGIKNISTKYTIKVRGDSKYSNIEHMINMLDLENDKIFCSPIYFRRWEYYTYHISDHILISKTENLKLMFQKSLDNFLKGMKLKYGLVSEQLLYKSYLEAKNSIPFEVFDDEHVNIMKKQIEIIDLEILKPYTISYSGVQNFDKHYFNSITHINEII